MVLISVPSLHALEGDFLSSGDRIIINSKTDVNLGYTAVTPENFDQAGPFYPSNHNVPIGQHVTLESNLTSDQAFANIMVTFVQENENLVRFSFFPNPIVKKIDGCPNGAKSQGCQPDLLQGVGFQNSPERFKDNSSVYVGGKDLNLKIFSAETNEYLPLEYGKQYRIPIFPFFPYTIPLEVKTFQVKAAFVGQQDKVFQSNENDYQPMSAEDGFQIKLENNYSNIELENNNDDRALVYYKADGQNHKEEIFLRGGHEVRLFATEGQTPQSKILAEGGTTLIFEPGLPHTPQFTKVQYVKTEGGEEVVREINQDIFKVIFYSPNAKFTHSKQNMLIPINGDLELFFEQQGKDYFDISIHQSKVNLQVKTANVSPTEGSVINGLEVAESGDKGSQASDDTLGFATFSEGDGSSGTSCQLQKAAQATQGRAFWGVAILFLSIAGMYRFHRKA